MKAKCFFIGIVGLFVAVVLTTSSYAKIDPETVVGMWSFDEGKGDIAADSSANKNDGTLQNGAEWTEGIFGEAIQFDGADDYVDMGNADSLSITGDLTFSLWLNISEYPTGWRNMLSKLVSDTNVEFNFRYKTSTEGQFYYGTGAAAIVLNWNPSEDLPLDTWTHVAGVRKSREYMKLYFDGVEKRSLNITTDPIPTDAHVTIGRQSDNKFYFNGIIDEVILFNVVLEEEDIKTLMNEGLPQAVDPSGKLVSTWAALRK